MFLGQEFRIFDWFIIHFTENNGMAFGMEFGGVLGKLALSIFRIVAVGGIAWYIRKMIVEKAPPVFITSLSLIFAGALGNILDSLFYGLIFSHSRGRVASLFPEDGGYAPMLQGKVVDMLNFPLWEGYLPEWLGGDYFVFFRPVFNIADAAISIGVALIILNQKKIFKHL